jgi:hypothetical protein
MKNRKIGLESCRVSWPGESVDGASQVVAMRSFPVPDTATEGRTNGLRRSHERRRLADSPWH